jgi:putative selenate reductase
MAVLRPYPFGALVRRTFREIEAKRALFDLPLHRGFLGDPARDLSVRVHGRVASSPFGPAAGPQSQLAQNIALSWLAGGRVIELKTVQAKDTLTIPRPCIDMQTVGYNIEWSQELTLEQSVEEYVKASMLVEMLAASGRLPLQQGFDRVLFDMSVGYDFAGITGERVQAFIKGMLDATPIVDRLRKEIPGEYRACRDLAYTTRLSDTLTLSTFHGCPPGEIERIVDWLLRRNGLHTVVKLNPMLLGPDETRLLLGALGYREIRVPDSAFARDTTWEQMAGFVDRLGETARSLDLGFGVKFTNTLIVENHRAFFPSSEREMYLSGPPLHVLAMQLVGRFRREFGDRYPISFSAGIDRVNFPDAVALGLAPVTVCTDLLKAGGYARGRGYHLELASRMNAVGARSIDEFVLKAYGQGGRALERLTLTPEARQACRRAIAGALRPFDDLRVVPSEVEGRPAQDADLRSSVDGATYERWVSEARLLNTAQYVVRVLEDPRYAQAQHSRPPRKIGRHLRLFDCISCDKCIPVCPNDANFTFVLPQAVLPITKVTREGGAWRSREEGSLRIEQPHQIGNFVDFCNDCGNCDVFCPEDGGPYLIKPRFFGTSAAWEADRPRDGFFLSRARDRETVLGRFDGREYRLEAAGGHVAYAGAGFQLSFDEDDVMGTMAGEAEGEVDLTYWQIMNMIRKAIFADGEVNYVKCLQG